MAKEKSSWAVGGGTLLGLGVGLFLLPDGLAFAGSLIAGIGIGLIASSIIAK